MVKTKRPPLPTENLHSMLWLGVATEIIGAAAWSIARNTGDAEPIEVIGAVVAVIGGFMVSIGIIGWGVYLGLQAHRKAGG